MKINQLISPTVKGNIYLYKRNFVIVFHAQLRIIILMNDDILLNT